MISSHDCLVCNRVTEISRKRVPAEPADRAWLLPEAYDVVDRPLRGFLQFGGKWRERRIPWPAARSTLTALHWEDLAVWNL
jgi:hypothetical protein